MSKPIDAFHVEVLALQNCVDVSPQLKEAFRELDAALNIEFTNNHALIETHDIVANHFKEIATRLKDWKSQPYDFDDLQESITSLNEKLYGKSYLYQVIRIAVDVAFWLIWFIIVGAPVLGLSGYTTIAGLIGVVFISHVVEPQIKRFESANSIKKAQHTAVTACCPKIFETMHTEIANRPEPVRPLGERVLLFVLRSLGIGTLNELIKLLDKTRRAHNVRRILKWELNFYELRHEQMCALVEMSTKHNDILLVTQARLRAFPEIKSQENISPQKQRRLPLFEEYNRRASLTYPVLNVIHRKTCVNELIAVCDMTVEHHKEIMRIGELALQELEEVDREVEQFIKNIEALTSMSQKATEKSSSGDVVNKTVREKLLEHVPNRPRPGKFFHPPPSAPGDSGRAPTP